MNKAESNVLKRVHFAIWKDDLDVEIFRLEETRDMRER